MQEHSHLEIISHCNNLHMVALWELFPLFRHSIYLSFNVDYILWSWLTSRRSVIRDLFSHYMHHRLKMVITMGLGVTNRLIWRKPTWWKYSTAKEKWRNSMQFVVICGIIVESEVHWTELHWFHNVPKIPH